MLSTEARGSSRRWLPRFAFVSRQRLTRYLFQSSMAGSKQRDLSRHKLLPESRKPEMALTGQKPPNDNMLTEYWQLKDQLEEKYNSLFAALQLEEASEINHRTSKLLRCPADLQTHTVLDTIATIKEEYENTRSLLLQQQLVELEEILTDFQHRLGKNS
jgi:hypothetical protein